MKILSELESIEKMNAIEERIIAQYADW
jgi:hypothetical protein